MEDTGSCIKKSCAAADGKKERSLCGISVDAAPFTPRSSILSGVPVASSIKTKPLSPNAPEFYPRNYAAVFQNSASGMTFEDSSKDPLQELRRTVAILIDRPADFDQVMAPLVQTLMANLQDEVGLSSVVAELLSQSVQQTNFHYSGARACSYLSQHLKLTFGSFHAHLISRCQEEYSHLLLSMPSSSAEDMTTLVGFTIFLGELLLSMKDSCSGLFVPELPQQIAQLLLTLLALNTHDSVHCAVQVLKLTGAVLEDSATNLNEIFSQLQKCSINSALPLSMQHMISSLIELRTNYWGRHEDEVLTAAGAGDTKDYGCTDSAIQSTEDPVYYDCQNEGYHIEDVEDFDGYCSWSGADGNSVNVDSSAQYWIGDQEMDADTATAFEEFIAESQPTSLSNTWSY